MILYPPLSLRTDSYKVQHGPMLPEGTSNVHSYAECRLGGEFEEIVFVGFQYILKNLETLVTLNPSNDLLAFSKFIQPHLGLENSDLADRTEFFKRLPVKICALPEGTVARPGDVLFTIQATENGAEWLVQYLESLLSKVWYPIAVASLGRAVKKKIAFALMKTTGNVDGLDFKLHDFGYRGVSSEESAGVGGMAHLVNFKGTDTMVGLFYADKTYGVTEEPVAGYSVVATEHSVMTSMGRSGEEALLGRLLEQFPTGILSVVSDSYDIYNFVENYVCGTYRDVIASRDGVLVVRPDSPTPQHPKPIDQILWIYDQLWENFGGTMTEQGYKLLNPKVNVLWGDGLDYRDIDEIIDGLVAAGYVPTIVLGMGGGLLQKVNRDTIRFTVKCSAQFRDGRWIDVVKDPLDPTKKSKAGLFEYLGLPVVFLNGKLIKEYSFDEVRKNAERGILPL